MLDRLYQTRSNRHLWAILGGEPYIALDVVGELLGRQRDSQHDAGWRLRHKATTSRGKPQAVVKGKYSSDSSRGELTQAVSKQCRWLDPQRSPARSKSVLDEKERGLSRACLTESFFQLRSLLAARYQFDDIEIQRRHAGCVLRR